MKNNSNLEFRKIKSLDYLYEINENGTILRNVKSKKQIKIFLDHHHSVNGYYSAFITFKGKVKRLSIHKLVAECWLGDNPNKEIYTVDHIDTNSQNNHYSNLRYATHSEQMKNRKLSDRIIKQATKNCYEYTMKYVAKKVIIKRDDFEMEFPSMIQCAKWLAGEYSVKDEHIRAKLKKRRSHIYDYDIIYLNAQTRHVDSKE